MLSIERRGRGIGFDPQGRVQLHGPRLRRQRDDVGDIGAAQDAIGHQIVGGLGAVIDPDDRDQRTLPFRRLQRRKRGLSLPGIDCRLGYGERSRRQ